MNRRFNIHFQERSIITILGLIIFVFFVFPMSALGQGTISRNKTQKSTTTTAPKNKQQHKQSTTGNPVRKPQNAHPQQSQQSTVSYSQKQEINRGKNTTFTVNGVSFTMIYVVGGSFTMGATHEQGGDAYNNEKPAHSVSLNSYYIGQTEVTQNLWKAVMGSNPSKFFDSGQLPVDCVSWDDCQEFIKKLNQLTGQKFRLPTEAEWEFAARGGNRSRGYKYSGSNYISEIAWYDDNSSSKTHIVSTKKTNELGLYDMSGNVWEWCQDWYDSYSSNSQENPTGPFLGSNRVLRGGRWSDDARNCRVSYRDCRNPSLHYGYFGFRLAL